MRVKSQQPKMMEADLTPMIDMVFQLIAFFMVLINFAQTENHERVQLPSSVLVKPTVEPLDFPIVIHVGEDGALYVGGDIYTHETIGNRLSSEISILKSRNLNVSDATVVIRAHKDVAAGEVQEVIRVAQDKQLINFALRVKEDRS